MYYEGEKSYVNTGGKEPAGVEETPDEETMDGKERTDDDKKREKILRKLREFGVTRDSEAGEVWDLERLKQLDFKHKGGKETPAIFFRRRPIAKGEFFRLLRDHVGVSREDCEAARRRGEEPRQKKIFYSPPDKEAALDAEKIRQDDSYLGIWDLGVGRRQTDWSEEIELASGEKMGTDELFLSRKIYRDFQGRRGQDGKLTVRDEDGGEREFSATYFAERTGFRGAGTGWDAPVRYLTEECPNLLDAGLLNLSDVRATAESSGGLYREARPIADNGTTYLDGAQYSLLSYFDCDARKKPEIKGRFKVIKLTKDLAGVITEKYGGPEITHLFKLKTKEEKAAKAAGVKDRRPDLAEKSGRGEKVIWSAYIVFGKGEIDFWPVSAGAENKIMPGESAEQYADRLRPLVKDFRLLDELSGDLSKIGLGLHSSLSWREQQWLAASVNETMGSKPRVISGAKKYGVNFLKAFLSSELSVSNGRSVLDLAEKARPAVAEKVFAKYAELIKTVESLSEQAAEFFKDKRGIQEADLNRVAFEMLKRAAALLANFARKQGDERELLRQLDRVEGDVVIFSSIFKTLFKGKEAVDFSEIRGLDLERVSLRELQAGGAQGAETMEAMARMHVVNREDQGEAGRTSAEKFRKFLASGAESDFYVLRRNGNLTAFIRFDVLADKPGHKYAASFNVDPAYRGSAIGQAMWRAIFEKEARGAVLEYTVYPPNEVGTMYVESGSVLTGVDGSGHYFTAECDSARQSRLRAPAMGREELADIFERQRGDGASALSRRGEGIIVRRFDMGAAAEVRQAMDAVSLLGRNGYVCSRYFYTNPKNKNIRYFVFEKEKTAEAEVGRGAEVVGGAEEYRQAA